MRHINVVLATMASCITGAVFAADATLNFTGNIIVPTCTVASGSVNQTITIPQAKVADFAAVGSTQQATAFNISLTSCAPSTNVSMTVSGSPAASGTGVLANTGPAAQVGIQLLKASAAGATTGTAVTLGALTALGTVDATNAMTIPMVAQYYRLGAMTAGAVAAVATVNFTYN
ncbi:fimbrial protein [Jeongeupia chitinilytica]|uniref:Fimbrial-type adhesion domain-containing protein n=1 Tax=Jeongeupia chitinilytica TaxID=1041641 RepID=A0ABQ3H8M5_9NEIS|nr:fimbrial protein [Jeongeupia chitinilytica]GHD69955.1 hypothetical protein GCM10007350_37370 [Jeongeupia chitinilytica]